MPKKMSGENSKATAARERKNEKLTADKIAKEKAKEDAYWVDDDKSLGKFVKLYWYIPRERFLDPPRPPPPLLSILYMDLTESVST